MSQTQQKQTLEQVYELLIECKETYGVIARHNSEHLELNTNAWKARKLAEQLSLLEGFTKAGRLPPEKRRVALFLASELLYSVQVCIWQIKRRYDQVDCNNWPELYALKSALLTFLVMGDEDGGWIKLTLRLHANRQNTLSVIVECTRRAPRRRPRRQYDWKFDSVPRRARTIINAEYGGWPPRVRHAHPPRGRRART